MSISGETKKTEFTTTARWTIQSLITWSQKLYPLIFFKLVFVFLDVNEHSSYWKKGDEHKRALLIQQNIIQAYWPEKYYFPNTVWNLGSGYCFPQLSDTKSEGRLCFFLFACLLSNSMVTTALPDILFVLRQEERSSTFLFLSIFHLLGLEECLTLLR